MFTMSYGERLGGAEQVLWTALRGDLPGVEPVVAFLSAGRLERELASLGVPTHVVPLGRFRDVRGGGRAVRALAALLREQRPDLVVHWVTRAQLYGSVAATLAGMSGRSVWWQHATPTHVVDRLATALPARAVLASSDAVAARQAAVRPARRTVVVVPGIEEPPALGPAELAALRAELGVPAGARLAGIVGRLHRDKGQDRFLEAIAGARRAGIDVHGVLVGDEAHGQDTGHRRRLEELAQRLGIGRHLTFAGQRSDATAVIQCMDVLVNACEREAFGLTLIEAMACRVPVVALDAPGPREILSEPGTGILVGARPSAGAGLGEALARVLADPAERARLAASGRRRFEQRYLAERMRADLGRALTALARS